jgi:hypothetical protein
VHMDDRSLLKRGLEFQICDIIGLFREFDLNF